MSEDEGKQGVMHTEQARLGSQEATLTPETSGKVGHTPGPWAWMGDDHGIYLATTHSGRRYVLGFRRMGLQSAQPVFRINHRMVAASDLVEFEVGDGEARGFAQGKADQSVYRYDISGIDAPDARLIAAAPDLLTALVAAERFIFQRAGGGETDFRENVLLPAIAKATGTLSDGHSEAKTGQSGMKTPSKTPLPGAGGE